MAFTEIKVAGNKSFVGMSHDSVDHWLLTYYLKIKIITMIVFDLLFLFSQLYLDIDNLMMIVYNFVYFIDDINFEF